MTSLAVLSPSIYLYEKLVRSGVKSFIIVLPNTHLTCDMFDLTQITCRIRLPYRSVTRTVLEIRTR